MKLFRMCFAGWMYFCVATALAEAALLAVLSHRGQLTPQVAEHLLTIAYDVPVRDIHDRLIAENSPAKKEMVSFAEVQETYMTASLNLDLREMSSDKGLIDLRELNELLLNEGNRYTALNEEFKRRWKAVNLDATDSELVELRRQIESVNPKVGKDQLLRILDDPKLDPELARQHVVTIFKNLPIDKRRKIIMEFKDDDAPRLHGILREIRLGMPEITLIRDTRTRLEEFNNRN